MKSIRTATIAFFSIALVATAAAAAAHGTTNDDLAGKDGGKALDVDFGGKDGGKAVMDLAGKDGGKVDLELGRDGGK